MGQSKDVTDGAVARRVDDAWHVYMENLFESMESLEQNINEASEMPMSCTEEWCTSARAALDDLNHAIFSIHEPRWSTKEDSDRIKAVKKKVYEIYARLAQVTPSDA